jgi:LmbE family N-acetylglucosaminyl deacetylase
MIKKNILVVAAHPDDEVLGCGGTVARMVGEGCEVYILIMGEGITSRDNKRDIKKRKKEIEKLRNQAVKANKVLGVKKVFFCNFPDNRFDTIPLLDIVKAIEKVKEKIKPNIIFTHYDRDLNIDHQVTYRAVITASRFLPGETAREIYSFEVLSSTECNYPLSFSPNVFFNIKSTYKLKLKAMEQYLSELKSFPHPRSIEAMKSGIKTRGAIVNLEYAEAFNLVRIVK